MSEAASTEIATAVPPEVVQNYPSWDCHFTGMFEKVTVGATWQMSCKGNSPLHAPLTLQYAAEDQAYSLVLLATKELTDSSAEFEVTSYKPGKYAPPYLVLTDGSSAIKIQGLQWEVQSVLPPQSQTQQPPQPFPPYGPFILYLPWWYWAIFVAIAVAVLGALISGLIFRKRRRRQREQLKKLESVLPPDVELQRDLRKIPRLRHSQEALEQMAKTLRVYLSRKLQILVTDLPSSQIKKKLRRRKAWTNELREVLEEIDRGLTNAKQVSEADILQLVEMVRLATDPMEKKK
jgi:hypothetical protein